MRMTLPVYSSRLVTPRAKMLDDMALDESADGLHVDRRSVLWPTPVRAGLSSGRNQVAGAGRIRQPVVATAVGLPAAATARPSLGYSPTADATIATLKWPVRQELLRSRNLSHGSSQTGRTQDQRRHVGQEELHDLNLFVRANNRKRPKAGRRRARAAMPAAAATAAVPSKSAVAIQPISGIAEADEIVPTFPAHDPGMATRSAPAKAIAPPRRSAWMREDAGAVALRPGEMR